MYTGTSQNCMFIFFTSSIHFKNFYLKKKNFIKKIQDGKFNPKSFKELVKSAVNDPSHDVIIDDIAKECESVTDKDHCEYGMKLTLCYKEVAEKHGVDFDEMSGL